MCIRDRASWISSNFITYDSQVVLADFSKRYTLKSLEQARVASTFDNLELDPEDRRALDIIKNGFVMPPPLNEELAGELSGIMTELEAMYGSGTHCFSENDCYDLEGFESIIDNSRDPDELLKALSNSSGSLELSIICLLYTSPSPRDRQKSRMPSSA